MNRMAKGKKTVSLDGKSEEYRKGYRAGYQMGAKFLRRLPSDLTDFNRIKITNDGHFYPTDEFKCSNCGLFLEDWNARDEEGNLFEFQFRYCPYCGVVVKDEVKHE